MCYQTNRLCGKLFILSIKRSLIDLSLRVHLLLNRALKALGCRHVYYAEFFTDRYIRRNFFPDFSYKGICVEVGCATPQLLSMSQHFRDNGWHCIGVEPNPSFVELHRSVGNEVYEYAAADFDRDDVDFTIVEQTSCYTNSTLSAHSYSALSVRDDYQHYNGNAIDSLSRRVIKVKVRRLDAILAQHCPSLTKIDILSVDVEGYELDVMRGFDAPKFHVKVVVLENLFHKSEYVEYMKSVGYSLQKRISYNYIFAPIRA